VNATATGTCFINIAFSNFYEISEIEKCDISNEK
jgi:hypothetical protein